MSGKSRVAKSGGGMANAHQLIATTTIHHENSCRWYFMSLNSTEREIAASV